MTPRVRLWMEVIGFVATITGCLIAFYQLFAPGLRAEGRAEVTVGIDIAFEAEGLGRPGLDPSKTGPELGAEIAAAIAEVREVSNAFELAAGQSKEVTDHGILVSNLGVRASGGVANQVRASLAGEELNMTLGVAYPLPAPAQNCVVQVSEIEDWAGMWRQSVPDKATFRVRCN